VKPSIDDKWLDLGSGDGTYLKFMSNQSLGLDIKANLKKKIRSWNFNDPIPSDLIGKFSVIWCSNLIEHVLRPHEFLLTIKKFFAPSPGGY
jgi:2-polyprenyl-3-methyl-5-hydroxy-6-metoxy-1,4-benzoquinol methylase